jgi:hypothetical protein
LSFEFYLKKPSFATDRLLRSPLLLADARAYGDVPFLVDREMKKAPATAKVMPSAAQVLSLVTFFRPVKKVTRLPAGTGEVEF